MLVTTADRVTIEGHVSPGFEDLREMFAENFTQPHELAAPVVSTTKARGSSTCGAVCGTSERASRGKRTRWSSSGRPRRGSPR